MPPTPISDPRTTRTPDWPREVQSFMVGYPVEAEMPIYEYWKCGIDWGKLVPRHVSRYPYDITLSIAEALLTFGDEEQQQQGKAFYLTVSSNQQVPARTSAYMYAEVSAFHPAAWDLPLIDTSVDIPWSLRHFRCFTKDSLRTGLPRNNTPFGSGRWNLSNLSEDEERKKIITRRMMRYITRGDYSYDERLFILACQLVNFRWLYELHEQRQYSLYNARWIGLCMHQHATLGDLLRHLPPLLFGARTRRLWEEPIPIEVISEMAKEDLRRTAHILQGLTLPLQDQVFAEHREALLDLLVPFLGQPEFEGFQKLLLESSNTYTPPTTKTWEEIWRPKVEIHKKMKEYRRACLEAGADIYDLGRMVSGKCEYSKNLQELYDKYGRPPVTMGHA